jgi:hypothetical protein
LVTRNLGGVVDEGSEQSAMDTVRLLELGRLNMGGFGKFAGDIEESEFKESRLD